MTTCELCGGSGVVTMTLSVFQDGGWMPEYDEVPCPECTLELVPVDDAPESDVLPAFELAYQY